MSKIDKWSPLRIPSAFRQYSDDTEGSGGDPMDQWDPDEWTDPDAEGFFSRLTPSHAGQWFIAGAVFFFAMGIILWFGQFFPLTHRNPWTLVAFGWPGSLLVMYVWAREQGFSANERLDWAFITTGRKVRVVPGKFVERFGNGDIQHIKFSPLKGRSFGAFKFQYVKLADLDANREDLISKATETNREPDDEARMLLPGPLTGENTDSILGRVYGVHGGTVTFHDSGSQTDMRVTNPSTLDDDIAADVLNQLELYDQRIIPELKSEIKTVETQKNRYKQRAEAERDPELDRIFGSIDAISSIVNRNGRRKSSDEDDGEVDEITERAQEQVNR